MKQYERPDINELERNHETFQQARKQDERTARAVLIAVIITALIIYLFTK